MSHDPLTPPPPTLHLLLSLTRSPPLNHDTLIHRWPSTSPPFLRLPYPSCHITLLGNLHPTIHLPLLPPCSIYSSSFLLLKHHLSIIAKDACTGVHQSPPSSSSPSLHPIPSSILSREIGIITISSLVPDSARSIAWTPTFQRYFNWMMLILPGSISRSRILSLAPSLILLGPRGSSSTTR